MKTQDIKNMGLAYLQVLEKSLKGNQHKLDMDKDGDIDAKDFAHMRKKKKAMDEEDVVFNPKMKDKKKPEAGEMAAEGVMDKVRDVRKKVFGKSEAEKGAEAERNAMAGFHNAMKKASDGMTKKKNNEEVEQVDEISKDKVGRYLKKAQISTADAGRDTMDDRKPIRDRGVGQFVKRKHGIDKAVNKLTGKAKVPATESVEQIDEISNEKKKEYLRHVADTGSKNRPPKPASLAGKHKAFMDIKHPEWNDMLRRAKKVNKRKDIALKVAKSLTKEETTEWPVYARIKENRAAHMKSATEPEAMDSKASKGEKDFKAMHKVDMSPAEIEKKGHDDASAAGRVTKKAAARNGDNPTGDTKIVNPVKKMGEAYAKVKKEND